MKNLLSVLAVLFFAVGFSRRAYGSVDTLFLNYNNPPTSCNLVTTNVELSGGWFNTAGDALIGGTSESPIFGVSWHCVQIYESSIFYDNPFCKCLETERTADHPQANCSNGTCTPIDELFPITPSKTGCAP